MIAVMKAGAPYLPLDPDYPEERMGYICEDAKIKIIITDNNFKSMAEGICNKADNHGE